MNKVLVVEEHNTGAEIFTEYMQEEFGIPFPYANSIEGALEAFMENHPSILIVEIVLPNSKSGKELHDMIGVRQHDIMKAQEKIKDVRPYKETADRMRVMDAIWGMNFMSQVELLNFSGGLVLLKLIKEYCAAKNIPMPKVLFYTTQSVYEHLQTLSEIFDDERNYIWIEKMSSVEKVVDAFRELTTIEAETV